MYQYKVMTIQPSFFTNPVSRLEQLLNVNGQDRWELCVIKNDMWIFKREIDEREESKETS